MKSKAAALRPLAPFTAWVVSALTLPAVSAAAPLDLRVVDSQGHSVPGVSIEFVDQPVGAFGVVDLPVRRTSDESGIVSTADLARPPLNFRVATASGTEQATHWAIRFIHGHRVEDTTAGPDLLGFKPRVYDLTRDVVCVVEEAGTIEIRVVGAKEGDQFHGAFVDQRPEPESHRNVTASGSFSGPAGSIRVPAGRGSLYLAQHGFLGAPALSNQGPLMVSVAPGQVTQVTVRFLDGPTARLIAPFDTIPFENMQALAPDGETVVADLPFEASPLRVPSRFAVTASGARAPSTLPSARYPKHLMRAVDVPLALPAVEDPNAQDVAKRYIERPPMELIFAVDPGAKMRLPEVSGGWVSQAEGGMALLSRAMFGARMDTGVARPGLGRLSVGDASADAAWSAKVTVTGKDGSPLPLVETFVAVPGKTLSRGITGLDGTLTILGLTGDSVAVGLVDSIADHARLDRPGSGESSVSRAIATGPRIRVRGSWKRSPEETSVGDLMVLMPASLESMADRRQFMTHAAPIAFVDAGGHFDFGAVPAGQYTLRAGSTSEAPLDLAPSDDQPTTDATLNLSGTGGSFSAQLQRGR